MGPGKGGSILVHVGKNNGERERGGKRRKEGEREVERGRGREREREGKRGM